jgi:hypothetical protein
VLFRIARNEIGQERDLPEGQEARDIRQSQFDHFHFFVKNLVGVSDDKP